MHEFIHILHASHDVRRGSMRTWSWACKVRAQTTSPTKTPENRTWYTSNTVRLVALRRECFCGLGESRRRIEGGVGSDGLAERPCTVCIQTFFDWTRLNVPHVYTCIGKAPAHCTCDQFWVLSCATGGFHQNSLALPWRQSGSLVRIDLPFSV